MEIGGCITDECPTDECPTDAAEEFVAEDILEQRWSIEVRAGAAENILDGSDGILSICTLLGGTLLGGTLFGGTLLGGTLFDCTLLVCTLHACMLVTGGGINRRIFSSSYWRRFSSNFNILTYTYDAHLIVP